MLQKKYPFKHNNSQTMWLDNDLQYLFVELTLC